MEYRSRYRKILWFSARAIIQVGFWDIILPKLGFGGYSAKNRSSRLRKIAVGFRYLAVQLGGVMIKVGQFLSARADVFPIEITETLAGLQDEVPAERYEDICIVAERDLDSPLLDRFCFFDPVPIAAASLGQVHKARIKEISLNQFPDYSPTRKPCLGNDEPASCGFDVVVKIQRPNIESIIAIDLAAIRTVGKWLEKYKPIKKRADIPSLINEFEKVLYQEIDYINEGNNIEIFTENFSGYDGVCVPDVVWSHTTRRVLTLSDIGGLKINSYDAISTAGISRSEVASRLLDVYFKQIFEDGFFHADPHPGNLFINPIGKNDDDTMKWDLALVDFGMVGTIKPEVKHGLREKLIAIATRDSKRLIASYQLLDVLLPGANLDLLEKANQKIFDITWGKSMSELRKISPEEMRKLLDDIRELVFNLPFQIPQDLIYLFRTFGLLSGMCTGLDPEFNAWDHIAPYAKNLLFLERPDKIFGNFPNGLTEFWRELYSQIQRMFALPLRAEALLSKVEKGELVVKDEMLTTQVSLLKKAIQQLGWSIVFAAFFIGTIQVYLAGESEFSMVLIVLTASALVILILGTHKNQ